MDITRWPSLEGIENVAHEGYLVKGLGMRSKKRYFVLDGVSLQYFADDSLAEMKGELCIKDAQLSIFSGTTAKGYYFEILVPQNNPSEPGTMRRYTVNATTLEERAKWCLCLAQNILAFRARSEETLTTTHLQWKLIYDTFRDPCVLFEGWLLKGTGFKAKKRFCRLMSNLSLVYFAKEGDDDSIKGVVSLLGASVEKVGDAIFGISINGGNKTSEGGADVGTSRSVEEEDEDAPQSTVSFQFKAPSIEMRNAWVDILRTAIKTIVPVGGAGSSPQDRNYIVASLMDISKGQLHLNEMLDEELSRRRAAGEILFGHRLQDVATVRLEQYAEPIPKALVILWQALIHKGQGIASEGIFRVTGSKDEIAASKKFISSGAWDKKVLGGALNGVFDKEWWQGQEHPKDAFCAGNLIKIWFRDLRPKLLDAVDLDAVKFSKPNAGEALQDLLGPRRCPVFKWLLDRCLEIEKHTHSNLMTKPALATVFTPNLFSDIAVAINDGANFFVKALQWRSRHFGGSHKTGVLGQPPAQVLIPEEDEDEAEVEAEEEAVASPSGRSVTSLDDDEWERQRALSASNCPEFPHRGAKVQAPTSPVSGGASKAEVKPPVPHKKLAKRGSGTYLSSRLKLKTALGLIDLTREQLQAIEDFRAGRPAPTISQRTGVDAMSFGLFIKSAGGVEHEVVLNMEAPQQVQSAPVRSTEAAPFKPPPPPARKTKPTTQSAAINGEAPPPRPAKQRKSLEKQPPPPPPKKTAAKSPTGSSDVQSKIAELQRLKKQAVADEDFLLAKQYKDEITKLEKLGDIEARIADLEEQKRKAVEEEDFLRAVEIKKELGELKAQQEAS